MKRSGMHTGGVMGIVVILSAAVSAGPVEDIVAEVDVQSYTDHHELLYTHDGDNRGFGPEHDLARSNIFDTFVSLGLETTLHPFPYREETYYNVVGILPGSIQPDQVYIVGAHYDSASNPGADDNASGVAAVMEAARVLFPHRFSDTIIFIAFDREEQGLYGSKAYAIEHMNDDIRGMVNLDMIAYNPNQRNQTRIYGRDFCVPIETALDEAFDRFTSGIDAIVQPDYRGNSDHHYFGTWDHQSAWIAEYDVWNNPHYHRQTDSSDTPGYIDYTYATEITRAVVGYLAEEAQPIGEYSLAEPAPGLAAQDNTLTAHGGEPGVMTWFVYGLLAGETTIPDCPEVAVNVAQPLIIGSDPADADGVSEISVFVPDYASGARVYIQAVEPASCRVSNLIDFIFP